MTRPANCGACAKYTAEISASGEPFNHGACSHLGINVRAAWGPCSTYPKEE